MVFLFTARALINCIAFVQRSEKAVETFSYTAYQKMVFSDLLKGCFCFKGIGRFANSYLIFWTVNGTNGTGL